MARLAGDGPSLASFIVAFVLALGGRKDELG